VLRREFKGRLLGRHSEKQELGTPRLPYGSGSVEISLRLRLDVICIELNTLTLKRCRSSISFGASLLVGLLKTSSTAEIGEALTGYVHQRSLKFANQRDLERSAWDWRSTFLLPRDGAGRTFIFFMS